MNKQILGLAVAAALATPALAQAADGPWLVRVRAVNLGMKNASEAGSGALGVTPAVLPADAIRASDKTIPEVDISYFFTKNIAAELVLTVPQKHAVSIVNGPLAESIGSFKHLPPTLTLQWHFLPEAAFRPYVGAGLNYTRISGVRLHSNVAGQDLQLDKSSVGAALQAGFDVPLGRNLVLNVDVKKIYIDTDVRINGSRISRLDLDPLAVGVGLGWRF